MKYLLSFILVLCLTNSLCANPPNPEVFEKVRSGEIPMPYYMAHEAEMMEGLSRDFDPLNRPSQRACLDEIEYNLLVLCVDFSDNVGQVEPAFFDSLVFDTTHGTVNHYFDEISYGNFVFRDIDNGTDFGWIRLPQAYEYYVNGQSGFGSTHQSACGMIADVLELTDQEIDYSQYDNDEDGTIDGVIVVHAGTGGDWTGSNDHMWTMVSYSDDLIDIDGKSSFLIATISEYMATPGDLTIGQICHELGHMVFNLPDAYDLDYSSNGVGEWSIMGGGAWTRMNNEMYGSSPSHPDAASRIYMGFADPIIVSENMFNVEIPSVNVFPTIFILWTHGDPSGGQYYLVENRGHEGYDRAIPADGLLIWHFDMAVADSGNRNEWYPGYTDSGHYLLALEQSDGEWDMERGVNRGDAGDQYPSVSEIRSFNSSTFPNSDDYDGNLTYVAVENISDPAPVMTADLYINQTNSSPEETVTISTEFEILAAYPNPFNPTLTAVINLPSASTLRVDVFNISGQKVKTLADDQYSQGQHSLGFDGAGMASGVYFIHASVPGKMNQVQKVILMK